MGLAAFLIAAPGLLAGRWALALRGEEGTAGLDHEVSDPGRGPFILGMVLIVFSLGFPVLTGRWAKKKWLGYVMVGMALCALLGATGLALMGIL